MSDTSSSSQMKPQDTVIFLLGQLTGQVGSMKGSLEASTATQTAVNAANELEHAKFRETLGEHSNAIAVLTEDKTTQRHNKLSGLSIVGLWIAGVGGLGGIVTAIFYITHP